MSLSPRHYPKTNVWRHAAATGVFAGLLWGFAFQAAEYFRFTETALSHWARPFVDADAVGPGAATAVGWTVFTLFSMAAALLYTALFRTVRSPWLGVAFGCFWWAMTRLTGWFRTDVQTLITDLCLFWTWGLFVGYSVSFEFTGTSLPDDGGNKPAEAPHDAQGVAESAVSASNVSRKALR
ncbi:MAG: hypothetical protein BLM47_04935 [Candidatus Reconcilbacillus cellulovorans]|uniref:Uncharacterized protein n=1 Tax=Candidatus Reconcilbacillus cellulovorans TaxID=1906605 RepID=A0A2A6E1F7_9BACL|nr:MAG: hypothetical protein BLM47_04935 [Candidatus Reconcilbacillus cellulovorans]